MRAVVFCSVVLASTFVRAQEIPLDVTVVPRGGGSLRDAKSGPRFEASLEAAMKRARRERKAVLLINSVRLQGDPESPYC